MKKKLIILMMLIYFVSCDTRHYGETDKLDGDSCGTSLMTLTIGGETHQYISFNWWGEWGGIEHSPNCKYCKSDKQKIDSLQTLVDSLTNTISNYKK